jgi:hypothetical protein
MRFYVTSYPKKIPHKIRGVTMQRKFLMNDELYYNINWEKKLIAIKTIG